MGIPRDEQYQRVDISRGWTRRENLVKGRETRSAVIAWLVTFINVVDRTAETEVSCLLACSPVAIDSIETCSHS